MSCTSSVRSLRDHAIEAFAVSREKDCGAICKALVAECKDAYGETTETLCKMSVTLVMSAYLVAQCVSKDDVRHELKAGYPGFSNRQLEWIIEIAAKSGPAY
jgi:hypothetical protein